MTKVNINRKTEVLLILDWPDNVPIPQLKSRVNFGSDVSGWVEEIVYNGVWRQESSNGIKGEIVQMGIEIYISK